MLRRAIVLFVVLSVVAPAVGADKASPKKPLGTWVREAEGRTVTFVIKADTLTVSLDDGNKTVATAAYGLTSEGVLFGVLTRVENAGDNGPEKGDLFRFQFSASKEELTISDLAGTRINEGGRKVVEGSYKAKRD